MKNIENALRIPAHDTDALPHLAIEPELRRTSPVCIEQITMHRKGKSSVSGLGLSRGAKLRTEPQNELLEQVLSNPMLPSPPAIALQIVEIVSKPDCQVKDISSRLQKDPGLCAKLLKTLNSCVYALSRPVTSVERGVTILGFHPLRSLILGLTLPAMQIRMENNQGLKQFWKESVSGAIIARELAKQFNRSLPEDILAASLVRDLGMILLNQAFPKIYQPMWCNSADLWGEQQCEWETDQVGIDHAEASAGLLLRWRLPDEIVFPVRYHHHPEQLPGVHRDIQERTHLLNFSSRLARLENLHNSPTQLESLLQLARDRFALRAVDLEHFLKGVRPQIEEFAAVLQVDIGTCPNFAEILASGCEALVGLSMGGIHEPTARQETPQLVETTALADLSISPRRVNPSKTNDLKRKGNESLPSECTIEFLENLGRSGQRVLIHDFEILGVIGRGGMGIVLKARDLKLNREVALKMLLPELIGSDLARQRFTREARMAAAIVHENVVRIFAVSEWNGVSFLVMEYVQGVSLQELLDSGRKFTVSEIVDIGRQCALGLAAAHKMRVIHRDIKPANILIDQATERVSITDFGMARDLDDNSRITQEGALPGTPSFMSPEQVNGQPVDHSTDLFSLGSLLYSLCTGRVPFLGKSVISTLIAVAEGKPAPIRSLNSTISRDLERLIEDLHVKNPTDRVRTAALVAERLAELGKLPSAEMIEAAGRV